MKKTIVMFALCLPMLAHAEMPNYDVKAYCARISNTGGAQSQMAMQGCFANEQASYDHIKPVWDGLSSDTKRYCQHIADYVHSYTALQGCVDSEKAAAQSNGDFTLKK